MMMERRSLLKGLIATTLAGALPELALASSKTRKVYPWKNWSGSQTCNPSQRVAPRSVEDLQTIIRETQGRIRPVGSGHSFSALVPTEDTLLSTRALAGLKSVDSPTEATFYGGTVLNQIGPTLNEHQQALINMPDIDQQTLAGAIATATHGTGKTLGSLSSYVTNLELVTASGDIISCSKDKHAEIFDAARVSLGSLGIISSVTMQNTQPFKLKRESEWMEFEETIANAHRIADKNRNFEFYYFPFTGMTLLDKLNITDEAVTQNEEIDGNSGVMDLKHARDYLSWSDTLRELILKAYMKTIEPSANVDYSYAIYATERNVRFNEMEYHLPAELGMKALTEIRQAIEKDFPEVFFPIECRFIKGDDIWLSPFYQRDTVSIAVHRYFEEDYKPLFKAIEPILKKYEGRPHWGKLNTLAAADFKARYPKFDHFNTLRQTIDPQGKFLNNFLQQIFG